MKVYKEITIPATKRKECTHRLCDICGKKGHGDEWSAGSYIVDETEISIVVKQKQGNECSDGGNGTEYDIDLCPDCFKNKLIPWLRSQGAHVQEIEWDW